jgi:hypothetical protein
VATAQKFHSEPPVPTKSTRVTPEQAERNAEQIVRLWEWGHDSLKRCPKDELVYFEATKRQKAELARLKQRQQEEKEPLPLSLNLDVLGKMRRIADEYSAEQIEKLADLVREHRSRVATTHLIRALAVDDRRARDSLLAQAVRQSWPLSVLERRAQIARGRRRVGAGRKPDVPRDHEQRLVMLEGLCIRWLRWADAAGGDLPHGLRKLVREADAAVAAVQSDVATRLRRPKNDGGDESGKSKVRRR